MGGHSNEVQLLRREGGLMSHEAGRPAQRPTSSVAVRLIELRVPEPQFVRLIEMARKSGRTPGAYAGDLFQAAYSARVKPTGDAALDEAVGQLGTAEAASGAALDILRAELARTREELAAAQAQAANFARLAEERGAILLDTREQLSTARGIQADQAEAIQTLMARVDALKNGHDPRSAAQVAPPEPPSAHQDMVEKAKGHARTADGALSPAFVRSVVGFAAVGQTPAWIAKTMRAELADVKAALAGRR